MYVGWGLHVGWDPSQINNLAYLELSTTEPVIKSNQQFGMCFLNFGRLIWMKRWVTLPCAETDERTQSVCVQIV